MTAWDVAPRELARRERGPTKGALSGATAGVAVGFAARGIIGGPPGAAAGAVAGGVWGGVCAFIAAASMSPKETFGNLAAAGLKEGVIAGRALELPAGWPSVLAIPR